VLAYFPSPPWRIYDPRDWMDKVYAYHTASQSRIYKGMSQFHEKKDNYRLYHRHFQEKNGILSILEEEDKAKLLVF
jgi:hypothetical protein